MNPVKAREKLLSVYQQNGNSIRRTARILSCSPSCVSKWVKRNQKKQPLESQSRAPKNPRRIIPEEHLIKLKEERLKTNFGRRRLARHLKDNCNIVIKEFTCAYWLRRFKLSKPCKQRTKYKCISYYNWSDLKPLQHWQIDTKEIKDAKTLPKEVYQHLIRQKLPQFQFTAISVKERIKFIAYAYSLNRSNGIAFMKLLISWLRANGINHRIYIQSDWGLEFGGPTLRVWNKIQKEIFEPRNAEMLKIRKSRWTDNAYVERTHRTDDEEFYIPKLLQINTIDDLFKWSYGYVTHFNTKRPHYGKHMQGKTPFEVLSKLMPGISKTFCFMPPIILDFVSCSPLFIKEETQRAFATYIGVIDVFDTY